MIRAFVVGSPRGGTTISQRLISEKGNLFTHPETKFFLKMVGGIGRRITPPNSTKVSTIDGFKSSLRYALGLSTRHDWSNLDLIDNKFNKRRVRMHTISRAYMEAFDTIAAENGFGGWLEKTPEHLHFLDEVQRYIPDARIIHIIRNGRDVVASRKDAAIRYRGSWESAYSNLSWNVQRWNIDTSRSASYVNNRKHIFVEYETLCERPSAALSLILEHIGATASSGSQTAVSPLTLARSDEEWKASALTGGIVKQESKWMSAFSNDERSHVESLLQPIPKPLQERLEHFRMRTIKLEKRVQTELFE